MQLRNMFACCLLYNVHALRLAVSPSAKI